MNFFSETYLYSDQPTTCPECGARAEIILDLSHTQDKTQACACMNEGCGKEFVMQCDERFDEILSDEGNFERDNEK